MDKLVTEYPHFFTATNLEWKNLLQPDKYKNIIIASMKHLVKERRVNIYGFVIMPNHIHIIWQLQHGQKRENVQRDFLKHTAQTIKEDMLLNKPAELKAYLVNDKDRKYQFWERNALSVELWSEKVFMQKLNYIHENPVRAGICKSCVEYKYSSALFYETGKDNWGFLTHIRD
jgi:REP element-mobilizing transposase RayT